MNETLDLDSLIDNIWNSEWDSEDIKIDDQSKIDLKVHVQNNHVVERIKANQKINFSKKSQFNREMRNKTRAKKYNFQVDDLSRFLCPFCNHKATQRPNLITHVHSQHEGRKYNCDECDKIFNYPGTLKQHQASFHMNLRYPCHLCEYKASDPNILSSHRKIKHPDYYKENVGKKGLNRPPVFDDEKFLINKYKIEKSKQTRAMKDKIQVDDQSRYLCPFCSHKATLRPNLLIHIYSKHEGRKYNCDKCDKSFSYQRTLKQHQDSFHMNMKYPCSLCTYKASNPSNLSNHRRFKHTDYYKEHVGKRGLNKPPVFPNDKRFKCNSCEFMSSLKFGLKRHIKKSHEIKAEV